MAWMNEQEAADRKNARMIDKVRLALPLELNREQRAHLLAEFAQAVGKGRVSWLAAVHDRGEDELNPHAHVVFRDRDFENGKRVAGLSEKGSTERIRETWEQVANLALQQAGREERIDRRTLQAQGLDRVAGIHMGPCALAMAENGKEPESRKRVVHLVNGQTRVIDYPSIDGGKTRVAHQAEIVAANENRSQKHEQQRQQQEAERVKEALEQALQRENAQTMESISQKLKALQRAEIEQEQALQRKGLMERDRPAPRMFERVFTAAADLTRRIVDRTKEILEDRARRPRQTAEPDYVQEVAKHQRELEKRSQILSARTETPEVRAASTRKPQPARKPEPQRETFLQRQQRLSKERGEPELDIEIERSRQRRIEDDYRP